MTTYYVTLTGDDLDAGSQGSPWGTIQHAADTVAAGDTVNVGAGTFYERVVMTTSGTSGSRITFTGTESGGELLTSIDGSDLVTATWDLSPGSLGAAGVYEATLPYEPYCMTLSGSNCGTDEEDCSKNIWRIGTDAMYENYAFAVGEDFHLFAGFPTLEQDASATFLYYYAVTAVPFWDGIEALFGYKDGLTYVRFRDGDDPNTLALRISPGPTYQNDRPTTGAAFFLDTVDYVTLQYFRLRGARQGVLLEDAHNNIIENNNISNGQSCVRLGTGSAENIVRTNILHSNHISNYTTGARTESTTYGTLDRVTNWHMYFVSKFTCGDSSEDNRGVFLWESGTGNLIYGNTIYDVSTGVEVLETEVGAVTYIYDNVIHNVNSQGLFLHQNTIYVYDNLLYDNGINIRFQQVNLGNQIHYVYRNRLWNPFGEQVYFHGTGTTTSTIWLYHNSFSGVIRAQITGWTFGDDVSDLSADITGSDLVAVNNIFGSAYQLGMDLFDVVDTNIMPPGSTLSGNVAYSPKPWGDTLPDFTLGPTSQARDAGIDLSAASTIQGRNFGAFPGITAAVDTFPDIGWYEYAETDILGDASITQSNQTLSGTGSLTLTGISALTQANQTLSSAESQASIIGDVSITQGSHTLNSAGVLGSTGSLTKTQENNTLISDELSPGSLTGDASLVQDSQTIISMGVLHVPACLNTLNSITVEITLPGARPVRASLRILSNIIGEIT